MTERRPVQSAGIPSVGFRLRLGPLRVVRTGEVFAEEVTVAWSLWDRAVGLLATADPPRGSALWIRPCRRIHTWFMRYPIDILVVDADLVVLAARSMMPPYRYQAALPQAHSVFERRTHDGGDWKFQTGDQLEFAALAVAGAECPATPTPPGRAMAPAP